MAGHDDTPDMRNQTRLEKQATDLGILDRVEFLGHLAHREVATVMADCDVLVDPRVINSFSSCLYEAMVMGVAVVASYQPCNRDALDDGVDGLLVRSGDPADLAEAIRTVLFDRALAERLLHGGAATVEQVAAETDCERVAAGLRRYYEDLLDRRQSTSPAPEGRVER